MRITRIKLVNFGKHADIDHDTDFAIVGLTGKNGSGKSTYMTAIKFAFTNLLENKQETYVKDWSKDREENKGFHPDAPNARVEIWFRKGGVKGWVMRQIGKTPKRELRIDDQKPILAEADIQQTLNDLLGCDRQALDNAVFIRQGELAHLIHGTAVDREALYARLLGISFCDPVSKYLEKRAREVASDLRDITTVKDEIQIQVDDAQTVLGELLAQKAQLPGVPNGLEKTLQDYQVIMSRQQMALRNWNAKSVAFGTIKANLDQMLSDLKQADPAAAESALEEELAKTSNKLTALSNVIDRKIAYDRLISEQASLISELEANFKQGVEKAESLKGWKAHILEEGRRNELIGSRNGARDRVKILERIAGHEAAIRAEGASIPELQRKFDEAVRHCEEQKNRETSAQARVRDLEELVKLNESILKAVGQQEGACDKEIKCAACNLTLAAGQNHQAALDDRKARLAEARALWSAEAAKLQPLVVLRQTLESKLEQHKNAVQNATANLESQKQALLTLPKILDIPDEEIEKILENHNQATYWTATLEAEVRSHRQRHVDLSRRQEENKKSLSEMADFAEEMKQVSVEDSQLLASGLRAEQKRIRETLQSMKEAVREFNVRQKDANDAYRELAEQGEALIQVSNQILRIVQQVENTYWAEQMNGLQVTPQIEHGVLRDVVVAALLQKVEQARFNLNTAMAKIEQQQKVTEAARFRLKQAEASIQEQKQRQELAEGLRLASRMFSRDGIPIAYMRQRFDEIAALTEYYLQDLDSDFSVRADSTSAITFEFFDRSTVTEQGEVTWRHQSKLSGGQTVRVTIAFLLAVQKLVIPEVGFLILDEPGLHLDEESLESLRDTLIRVGEAVGDDQQIWLCDHRPTLHMAVQKRIEF